MQIVHLGTTQLRKDTIVRPLNALGTMGSHNGQLWEAIALTHRQAKDHTLVRRAWNARNRQLMAVSVNGESICEVQS